MREGKQLVLITVAHGNVFAEVYGLNIFHTFVIPNERL